MAEVINFEGLKIQRQFLNALDDLSISKPTEIQQKVIPIVSSGQDIIGIAPTGTGKTLSFVLPLLTKLKYAQGAQLRAIIFAPSKELVLQIFEDVVNASKYTDLRSAAIYGGVGSKAQVDSIKSGLDI